MLLVQEVAQREGDGPPQAAIGNDELVLGGQLDNAELVDEPGQDQNACQEAGRGEVSSGAPDHSTQDLGRSLRVPQSAFALKISQRSSRATAKRRRKPSWY